MPFMRHQLPGGFFQLEPLRGWLQQQYVYLQHDFLQPTRKRHASLGTLAYAWIPQCGGRLVSK
jgi:hypothetical protein